jgi:RNA polymerase sigma-70 factor (ECF subfamily)
MHPSLTDQPATDDAACIAASVAEPERFGELYDRHASTVFRYVRSRLGPDADDAVGDTFAIAFGIRDRFDASFGSSALPWLLGIATKVIAKRRDAERRWLRPTPPELDQSDDDVDAANARIDDVRLASWLVEALRGLRRRDRDALLLHVVGDLSIEEVAHALDVPAGTIKSRLHRARRILAAQLEVHR